MSIRIQNRHILSLTRVICPLPNSYEVAYWSTRILIALFVLQSYRTASLADFPAESSSLYSSFGNDLRLLSVT